MIWTEEEDYIRQMENLLNNKCKKCGNCNWGMEEEEMNKKVIDQIKAIEGVKTVECIDNMAVVVFEPREPVIHDEYGVPLCDGDKYWWINTSQTAWNGYRCKKVTGDSFCEPYKPYSFEDTIIDESDRNYYFKSNGVHLFASKESAERWIEENKPKSIYTDTETGDEFFDGDEVFFFNKKTFKVDSIKIDFILEFNECNDTSKVFKSRKDCEIALANYILNKYK